MKRQTMYRQGDVLLFRVDGELPATATPVEREQGRIVLAHGEVTGHAHAIDAREAQLFAVGAIERLLRVTKKVTLKHEEHTHIDLPMGIYRVVIQREYHPEEIRNVAD